MVLILLMACDQKELEMNNMLTNQEIRLSTRLESQTETRAISQSHLADATHFAAGQPVALFIIENRTSPTAYTGDIHTMTTGENDVLDFDLGANCYWPGNTPVNFFAWYPYTTGGPFANNKKSMDNTTFTVNSDQSSPESYTACDLMFASSTNVVHPQSAETRIPLVFSHKLSQVVVILQSTNDQLTAEQLAKAQITIDGTESSPLYLTADVDIDGGTATFNSTGTTAVQLKLGTGATTFAVLPPGQSLLGKKIYYTLENIATKEYTINTIGVLEAGKKYTITLSLTLSQVNVTETVTDWQHGGDDRDYSDNSLYI